MKLRSDHSPKAQSTDSSVTEQPPEVGDPCGSDLLVRDAVHGDDLIHDLQSTRAQLAATPLPARDASPFGTRQGLTWMGAGLIRVQNLSPLSNAYAPSSTTLCRLPPEVSVSNTTTLYLLERQQGSRPRSSLPALKLLAAAASPVHQMRA